MIEHTKQDKPKSWEREREKVKQKQKMNEWKNILCNLSEAFFYWVEIETIENIELKS